MVTDIDLIAYREFLRWLLNYTASDIPAPSSIAQSFFNSYAQLDSPYTYGIAQQNFQSIVAFPFWLFNNNNWGNIAVKSDTLEAALPPQFYTKVLSVGLAYVTAGSVSDHRRGTARRRVAGDSGPGGLARDRPGR